ALATQAAKATEEISGQIAGMQGATRTAVEAIGSIGLIINEISGISTAIAGAIEQQGAATREITRNTNEAAQGTQEVSRNVAGVNRAARETGQGAAQVLTSSTELSRQAEELRSDVGGFLLRMRAA